MKSFEDSDALACFVKWQEHYESFGIESHATDRGLLAVSTRALAVWQYETHEAW